MIICIIFFAGISSVFGQGNLYYGYPYNRYQSNQGSGNNYLQANWGSGPNNWPRTANGINELAMKRQNMMQSTLTNSNQWGRRSAISNGRYGVPFRSNSVPPNSQFFSQQQQFSSPSQSIYRQNSPTYSQFYFPPNYLLTSSQWISSTNIGNSHLPAPLPNPAILPQTFNPRNPGPQAQNQWNSFLIPDPQNPKVIFQNTVYSLPPPILNPLDNGFSTAVVSNPQYTPQPLPQPSQVPLVPQPLPVTNNIKTNTFTVTNPIDDLSKYPWPRPTTNTETGKSPIVPVNKNPHPTSAPTPNPPVYSSGVPPLQSPPSTTTEITLTQTSTAKTVESTTKSTDIHLGTVTVLPIEVASSTTTPSSSTVLPTKITDSLPVEASTEETSTEIIDSDLETITVVASTSISPIPESTETTVLASTVESSTEIAADDATNSTTTSIGSSTETVVSLPTESSTVESSTETADGDLATITVSTVASDALIEVTKIGIMPATVETTTKILESGSTTIAESTIVEDTPTEVSISDVTLTSEISTVKDTETEELPVPAVVTTETAT